MAFECCQCSCYLMLLDSVHLPDKVIHIIEMFAVDGFFLLTCLCVFVHIIRGLGFSCSCVRKALQIYIYMHLIIARFFYYRKIHNLIINLFNKEINPCVASLCILSALQILTLQQMHLKVMQLFIFFSNFLNIWDDT